MTAAKRKKNAHLWKRDPDDWYVEPRWCSERLFAVEDFGTYVETGSDLDVVDPSCGLGRILDAAWGKGLAARGMDLKIRRPNAGIVKEDFFADDAPFKANIASNPPYKHCGPLVDFRYIRHAFRRARPGGKVALLLPTTWASSEGAVAFLPSTPLKREWRLAPRPSMPPGAVIAAGEKPGRGRMDFSWFVWELGYVGPPTIGWLHRDG